MAQDVSSLPVAPIEEIIRALQGGHMVIVTDDEHRENEGDLLMPGQKADADAINFMARYGRGLICLALEKKRVDALGLPLMSAVNRSRHQTAFTVSIEAKEGITTGISAADRARTIAVAIDSLKGKDDIVSPGHVFPLVAREGGVLVRAGHTEAAVDLARIAGFSPCGVICEIMNDDGTMAKGKDLALFARRHDLRITTIARLIAWRLRFETLVTSIHRETFRTRSGSSWTLHVYMGGYGEKSEHMALVKDDNRLGKEGLPVRVHRYRGLYDLLDCLRGDNDYVLSQAMHVIEKQGCGVIVLIGGAPRQGGWAHDMSTQRHVEKEIDVREYGIGAQILCDLGVKDMTLLSNRKPILHALEGYGLRIRHYQPLSRHGETRGA
ncbi:MAG: 3,4-dihydroxy-2-butanone-4-phosphate synthase [Alphaproteobacteria bacterium GM7ARS4]|nr:3,4-dihydroxy-2-butanone-4-phosphate synthase [Alphaproteobacteria bacterium GM7ARS4]